MNSDSFLHGRPYMTVLGLIGTALLPGCADFQRGPHPLDLDPPVLDAYNSDGDRPDTGAPNDGAAAPLSYAATVHGLLQSGCEGCHRPGGEAGNTGYVMTGNPQTDYQQLVVFIDADQPTRSRLLTKAAGNGHQGGAVYPATSSEHQTLLQWIQGGAQP